MNRPARRVLAAVASAALLTLTLSACDKGLERYQDAPVGTRDAATPADLISFPDGYSNVAQKCDGHGHRVYVAFHGDQNYAALAVVDDPTCVARK